MNAATTANTYKTQQVMTASKEELTLMLYNGAIRFVSESIKAMDTGELEKAHYANLRAQEIVQEFMVTLDMSYDIAKSMYMLYDYIKYRLVQANIQKDKEQLIEARDMLAELRDAWYQAMKQARVAEAVGR
ncbi:MAG: fliS [Firmicutes bacterium]|nr:fliS [Bacillota bacterium]